MENKVKDYKDITLEEEKILKKDITARLPYGVYVDEGKYNFDPNKPRIYTIYYHPFINICKPYLRPMSSMTQEEKKELNDILPYSMSFSITKEEELKISNNNTHDSDHFFSCYIKVYDWLNSHCFDYRSLIKKGLAHEMTKDMYECLKHLKLL